MNLEQYLKFKNIKQYKFAEQIGVSWPTIGYYIRGERTPPMDIAQKILIHTRGMVDVHGLYPELHALEKELHKKMTDDERKFYTIHKSLPDIP